jgi:hypothetical protein
MIQPSRRGFLVGLGVVAAAPAVVRAESLMRLRGLVVPTYYYRALSCYEITTDSVIVRLDKAQHLLPTPVPGVAAMIDEQRTDRLINLFDNVIGDVAPGQQRHVDFSLGSIAHHPIDQHRVGCYIDELRAYDTASGRWK